MDQTVAAIGTAYDELGRVWKVTTYGDVAETDVLSQVEDAYDEWGNLIEEWQSHGGPVDTSSTPSVQYVYDDGCGTGSASAAAYVRLTDVIYPNGRDVSYGYGTPGGVDDIMSRLTDIKTNGESTANAAYTYLGAGTIASENYTQPQVKLDYSASDFAAWDRFGQVLNQVWSGYGQDNSGTLDGYSYTYDQSGNRLTRGNLTDSALSEIYGYDNLDRLTSVTHNGVQTESWDLDSLGNFAGSSENSVAQTRATDSANEIQSITQDSTTSAQGYDAAGNMTTIADPNNPNGTLYCTYDAWNRLVEVQQGSSSGAIVAEYRYDGTGRRIEELTDFDESGTPQTVTHYYLDSSDQVLEERSGSPTANPQSLIPSYQYIWSPRYIDAPILRDSFNTSGQIVGSSRMYYLGDANFNVTALVNASGAVVERYAYTPYGKVTVFTSKWDTPANPNASSFDNTRLFAGMDTDSETGLGYDRARYYSVTTGAFIGRDPIGYGGGDASLYSYAGNSPADGTDPTGWVVLKAIPDEPDSMPWKTAKLPAGKAGNTKVVPELGFQVRIDTRTGKCHVLYVLRVTETIQLDPAQIKKSKMLTLKTAYGHEQLHVQNAITIMKQAQKMLEPAEKLIYDSDPEAKEDGNLHINNAKKWIQNKLDDDAGHEGTDPKSPTNGLGYPPKGTMPKGS